MTDLETRIRDALRADEIGWDDLRQQTLRVAPRSPRRWPTMLAAAAVVAMVAGVAVAIAVTGGSGSNGPAGSHPAYAGYAWKMTGLADRHGPITEVASIPARIDFSDTAVSGTLAGASIFGAYQVTSHGYNLTTVGLAGATGAIVSGKKQRVGAAFASVFVRTHGRDLELSNPASVTAQVTGDHLRLHAGSVTMRLSRIGPSHVSPIIDAVGYMWNVKALSDGQGRLLIPGRLHAAIGFAPYGELVANDTVNTIDAMFGVSSDGYVARDVVWSAEGYAGHDPAVIRLQAAVRAMVTNTATVSAVVDGRMLTLRRNGITLTLQRGVHSMSAVSRFTVGAASATASSRAVRAPGVSSPAPETSSNSAPISSLRPAGGAPGSHH